jgi:hypothetical protein
MEDGSRILGEIDEAGGFVWALEPGIYVINRINYRDPWSGNYFVVPKVAFRVPGPGRVYYVGTLTADFEPKRDLIGGLSGKLQVRIEDEFEGDYSPLAAELGLARGEIEQSLIVHASDLPQTIDSTAEFQLAMQVLNAALYGLSQ